jgi:hypothetical protein
MLTRESPSVILSTATLMTMASSGCTRFDATASPNDATANVPSPSAARAKESPAEALKRAEPPMRSRTGIPRNPKTGGYGSESLTLEQADTYIWQGHSECADNSANPYPAVVAIVYRGDSWCTGTTLLNGKTILTAAHCFDVVDSLNPAGPPDGPLDMSMVSYFDACNLNSDARSSHMHQITQTPAFQPGHHKGVVNNNLDLAILCSDEVVTTMPMTLSTSPPQKGDPLLFVGYGEAGPDHDGVGEKRSATLRVSTSILGATFQTSLIDNSSGVLNTCKGDSGGPGLRGTSIVGIVSGPDQCTVNGINTRVDSSSAGALWIRTQAALCAQRSVRP